LDFARLFWMLIGPALLFLLLLGVGSEGRGWFSPVDIAFLLILAAMIYARSIEFRGGRATTSTGEPATEADLRRYVGGVLLCGIGIWIVANVIGNHWLG
jgi:hypothetical protein